MQVLTPTFSPVRLAVMVTVAACALSNALSAEPAEASTAQLQATKAYANVSIAEDDVATWGPWEQLEPPQAGPGATLRDMRASRDVYRPLTIVPVAPTTIEDFACTGGSLCGYGVMFEIVSVTPVETGPSQEKSARVKPQVMTMPVIGETSLQGLTSNTLDDSGQQISLKLVSIPGGVPTVYSPLNRTSDSSYYRLYKAAVGDTMVGLSADWDYLADGEVVNVQMGPAASFDDCESCIQAGMKGLSGVMGKATTAEQLNAVAAYWGSRVATYYGMEYAIVKNAGHANGVRAEIQIDVDFSKRQFVYTSGLGDGYQATGALTSNGYKANAFSSGVSGMLRGTFVGDNAQSTVGGAHLNVNGTTVDSFHYSHMAKE